MSSTRKRGEGVSKTAGFATYHVNISAMSYRDAAICSSFEDMPPTIFISIDDAGFPITPLDYDNVNVAGILKLWFSDIPYPDAHAMSEEDGKRVVEFVKRHLPLRPDIVVHCAAGVSRSAGVAAALGKWLNGDDSFVFDSPYKNPNMLCYKRVLEAAGVTLDEAEVAEKEAAHRKLWDAWHDDAYMEAQMEMLHEEADNASRKPDVTQADLDKMDASWEAVFGEDASQLPGHGNRVQTLMAVGLAHEDEDVPEESWPL